MKLKQLLKGLEGIEVKGSKEVEISGISIDSRSTSPGHLFVAKKGTVLDGAQFIQQAAGAGAAVILSDIYDPFLPLTQIIHPHPQDLEALLAARYYQRPSQELFVFGATGNKGKTTTTYVAKHVMDALGLPSGLIGTVETIAGENRFFSTLTTHDAVYNQKLLREMVSRGCKAVSLEVSSHGLVQNRVAEIAFDVALFTNLTPDHFEYHKTIEEYAEAKKKIFRLLDESPKKNKRALFNADNPWTSWMREGLKTPAWTFGIDQEADVRASDISFGPAGTRFAVHFQGASALFETTLIGRFNVYNLLGGIALGLHLGASPEDLRGPIASFQTAPGRLERVNEPVAKLPAPEKSKILSQFAGASSAPCSAAEHILQESRARRQNGKMAQKGDFTGAGSFATGSKGSIFIDYAHTGDSLDNVLRTLREITPKRLIVVFGCGGNRDPARRVGMARAAERYADLSVVTSDNPRNEDPEEICRQILSGFQHSERVFVELDRKAAIFHAVQILKEGDVLLIAGKGHERVQIFSHKTVPFDDADIARQALAARLS